MPVNLVKFWYNEFSRGMLQTDFQQGLMKNPRHQNL